MKQEIMTVLGMNIEFFKWSIFSIISATEKMITIISIFRFWLGSNLQFGIFAVWNVCSLLTEFDYEYISVYGGFDTEYKINIHI